MGIPTKRITPTRRNNIYAVIAPIPLSRISSVGMNPKIITKRDERNATPEMIHIPILPPGIVYERRTFGWE